MRLTTIRSLSGNCQIKAPVVGLIVLAVVREGLLLLVHFGMQCHRDYVNKAYLWLLIGVLYRLPKLAEMPQPVPVPGFLRGVPRWRLALIGK
jgi:hypothetical protein